MARKSSACQICNNDDKRGVWCERLQSIMLLMSQGYLDSALGLIAGLQSSVDGTLNLCRACHVQWADAVKSQFRAAMVLYPNDIQAILEVVSDDDEDGN